MRQMIHRWASNLEGKMGESFLIIQPNEVILKKVNWEMLHELGDDVIRLGVKGDIKRR